MLDLGACAKDLFVEDGDDDDDVDYLLLVEWQFKRMCRNVG